MPIGGNRRSDDGGRGLGGTIRRILKIKLIMWLVLIVLSIFGVLYIIDWFRGVFGTDASVYLPCQTYIVQTVEYIPLSL